MLYLILSVKFSTRFAYKILEQHFSVESPCLKAIDIRLALTL